MLTYLIVIVACLLLEGFFSGSEMAIISTSRAVLHYLAKKDSKKAILALEILKSPGKIFTTTLIGTNICIVINTFTMNALIRRELGDQYTLLVIIVAVPVILIFGEIIPKTLYRMNANRIILHIIYPMRFMMWILHPLVSWPST